jgi:hypothetical protein
MFMTIYGQQALFMAHATLPQLVRISNGEKHQNQDKWTLKPNQQ